MKFDCEVRALKPSLVLARVKGVLDAGTSVQLEMALGEHLKNSEVKKIILDIPELTFISSSGLRVLMLIIKHLVPRNGRLYLVGAAPQIVGLIKMSGMTKWVNFKDSLLECENE